MRQRIKFLKRQYRRAQRDPIGRWLLCIVYVGLGLMTATVALLWIINRDYDDFVIAAGARTR